MMLRAFDLLVKLTASVPIAGVVVIVTLGLATDLFEALTRHSWGRRTRDAMLS